MKKIISVYTLKGGTGKTTTAINIARILNKLHDCRTLLVDNDQQGNTSKFFGLHDESLPSVAEVLTVPDFRTEDAIRHTGYDGLDVIPANMRLVTADRQILTDVMRSQQYRLRDALEQVADRYDYCIIDNAPNLAMSTVNAIVASDEILVPVKVDRYGFDGLVQLVKIVKDLRGFNPDVHIAGCIVTMYSYNNVNAQGWEQLKTYQGLPVFSTVIRKTVRVDETTFEGKPLIDYAPRSTAAQDYVALVAEYLKGEQDAKG